MGAAMSACLTCAPHRRNALHQLARYLSNLPNTHTNLTTASAKTPGPFTIPSWTNFTPERNEEQGAAAEERVRRGSAQWQDPCRSALIAALADGGGEWLHSEVGDLDMTSRS